jgi:hypothetical protein
MATFISTRLVDRARWQREEALRWDAKRLDCYSEFAVAIKRFIAIAARLCAGLGLPETAQPLDPATGLPALAAADQDLSVKWEQVMMLGSPDAITAAREWRSSLGIWNGSLVVYEMILPNTNKSMWIREQRAAASTLLRGPTSAL